MESNNRPPSRVGRAEPGRFLLIGAAYLYVALLVLAPLLAILGGVFREGLNPIWTALCDPALVSTFRLSILIGIGVTALHAVTGTLVAWVLARHEFKGREFINGLIDAPFAISPVVVGYMLLLLFGRQGLFAPLLQPLNIKVAFAVPGMVLATFFVTLPIMIREMLPVIQTLDRSEEFAAATLGAGRWQTFWQVIFPALKWGIIYGLSLTLARALGEFGAVLVIGGGIQGRTDTATVYIYHALEERQYIAAYSAALLLGCISIAFVVGADLLKRRKR
ncbi:MAG: sulfate ABC transporter permease subunit [Anaerolineales bacterium]|nr:sulfate ABC transporter permease subunit [Anaerolineales bacterium]